MSDAGARTKGRYLILSLAVLAFDQWTKWWIELALPLQAERIVIPGFANLIHVRNTGVAFGLFSGPPGASPALALTVLGLAAMALVSWFFWRAAPADRLLLTSLALILGGAVGNLLDRVISGAVTDFIDLYAGTYHWPAFNVADSAISVGIGLLLIDAFRARPAAAGDR